MVDRVTLLFIHPGIFSTGGRGEEGKCSALLFSDRFASKHTATSFSSAEYEVMQYYHTGRLNPSSHPGIYTARPGGVSGYPRAPGIGQFREFESPRVHTRINSWELFLVHKLTCGKRESVS